MHYRRSGWSAAGCLAELGSALLCGPLPSRKRSTAVDDCSTRRLIGPVRQTSCCFLGGLEALDGQVRRGSPPMSAKPRATYEEIGEVYALREQQWPCSRLESRCSRATRHAAEHSFRRVLRRRSSGWMTGQGSRLSRQSSPMPSTLKVATTKLASWLDLAERARRGRRRQRSVHLATGAGKAPGPRRCASTRRRRWGARPPISLRGRTRSAITATSCSTSQRCSGSPIELETAARQVEQALRLFERKGNVVSARQARRRC